MQRGPLTPGPTNTRWESDLYSILGSYRSFLNIHLCLSFHLLPLSLTTILFTSSHNLPSSSPKLYLLCLQSINLAILFLSIIIVHKTYWTWMISRPWARHWRQTEEWVRVPTYKKLREAKHVSKEIICKDHSSLSIIMSMGFGMDNTTESGGSEKMLLGGDRAWMSFVLGRKVLGQVQRKGRD